MAMEKGCGLGVYINCVYKGGVSQRFSEGSMAIWGRDAVWGYIYCVFKGGVSQRLTRC